MESDTVAPGDRLNDLVETPAGKREYTPVFRHCHHTRGLSNKQSAVTVI